MIKFNSPKPWAVALAASFVLTYGSFTFIASSFQQAASDSACVVQLPTVTAVGKRAAADHEFAGQSIRLNEEMARQRVSLKQHKEVLEVSRSFGQVFKHP